MVKDKTLPTQLSTEDRRLLLQLAREALRAHLERTSLDLRPYQGRESLRQPAGAFVTWKIEGDLRGCIGNVVATGPLFEAVASNAVSAATRDPRFSAVSREEAGELELEISVLTPMTVVDELDEIEVGRDGLMVQLGGRAGLLLPQVASEYGWDRQQFLEHTCMKAGLPPDSYKDPRCRVEKFSAEVFDESTVDK